MDTKINNWQTSIDETTQKFLKSFADVSPEKLYRKPNPNTWSIAENIQHLILINESYFPIFKQLEEGTYQKPFIGNIGFLHRAIGNMILKSVTPENQKKIKTIPIWEPNKYQGPESDELLKEFENHQKALSAWIPKLKPFLEKHQVINSPANKLIAYSLETALDIITVHEKRHYEQSHRLLIRLNNQ
ncbi:DinB family protein [Echinicola sp. 20G]|uniref:DinB family protein n=1 Tax=Echinicola sp. 20G TaxID=2781961 RepID=UPI001F271097|nr:DinB family protein [Echinicola sp. 20G]